MAPSPRFPPLQQAETKLQGGSPPPPPPPSLSPFQAADCRFRATGPVLRGAARAAGPRRRGRLTGTLRRSPGGLPLASAAFAQRNENTSAQRLVIWLNCTAALRHRFRSTWALFRARSSSDPGCREGCSGRPGASPASPGHRPSRRGCGESGGSRNTDESGQPQRLLIFHGVFRKICSRATLFCSLPWGEVKPPLPSPQGWAFRFMKSLLEERRSPDFP
ncbi:uncharacterized protein LOC130608367 [Pezoporus wallicus]|uniref:uncharacterized protein LOC130608367 n=1 Tax=Pezoporus wallicus TaxID=35540 RepID=UPI002551738A|nr:uncharacterized protein LOC130608367 [Pezoporus wallicus]